MTSIQLTSFPSQRTAAGFNPLGMGQPKGWAYRACVRSPGGWTHRPTLSAPFHSVRLASVVAMVITEQTAGAVVRSAVARPETADRSAFTAVPGDHGPESNRREIDPPAPTVLPNTAATMVEEHGPRTDRGCPCSPSQKRTAPAAIAPTSFTCRAATDQTRTGNTTTFARCLSNSRCGPWTRASYGVWPKANLKARSLESSSLLSIESRKLSADDSLRL